MRFWSQAPRWKDQASIIGYLLAHNTRKIMPFQKNTVFLFMEATGYLPIGSLGVVALCG